MMSGTSQPGSINCPSCSGQLARDSRQTHCYHCQKELPNEIRLLLATEDSSYHDTDPSLRTSDGFVACPRCKEPIDQESRFCKHCAFDLRNPASSTRTRHGVITAIVAGVLVVSLFVIGVIAVVIIGLYFSSRSKSPIQTAFDSGKLTTDKAQRALNTWVSSGSVTVRGIQEVPTENAAVAQLSFSNLGYNLHDPLFGGQKSKTYSGPGTAIFTHYNDGRWVLTKITIGQGFDAVWWDNLNINAQ